MKNYLLVLLIVSISLCSQTGNVVYKEESGFVTRIVDGDTFYFENKRVRLIGIDTPESYQECYKEATEKLKELILNRRVVLEKDILEADEYDRLLRYVYVNKTFVNLEMVKSGYAYSNEIEPDTKYSKQFEDAENFAMENKFGCLWNQR